MHALIIGDPGAGKSTLIRRVAAALGKPVAGYESKKETELEQDGLIPVYLYEAGQPHVRTGENLAGYCNGRQVFPDIAAFDRFASRLQGPAAPDTLIILDEIGIMESRSEPFKGRILDLLDGDAPVLAAVKCKHTPFLESVRSHPRARCFYLTEENRETVFFQVLDYLRKQLP